MAATISGFPMPTELEVQTETDTYAKFTAQPFQRGFGHSIGNTLRRILLSSLEGAAISATVENMPQGMFIRIR